MSAVVNGKVTVLLCFYIESGFLASPRYLNIVLFTPRGTAITSANGLELISSFPHKQPVHH